MANEVSANDDMERGIEALRNLLAEAGKKPNKETDKAFKNIDAGVDYKGTKITLPDDPRRMTLREGRDYLTLLEQAEETVVQVIEPIKNVHPFDGAVAFMRALQEIYSWASPVPTPSFFGPQPPVTISIETGPDETAVIFWGSFRVPQLGDVVLQTTVDTHDPKKPVFQIVGTIRRKYVEAVHAIAELTRKLASERSIYRGQAVRLSLTNGDINWQEPPSFINLKRINENELVLSEDVGRIVQTNLWTPIEYTQRCRDEGVPLKRGALLEGPYGAGKTLIGSVTAKKCVAHNWTFIIVPKAAALEPALHFAAFYQPCVLFVEDIDRELKGERTEEMDAVLNTVDGIVSKGAEIVVIYTSNNAAVINRAMMRPGRLDAVIHIDAPDGPAVEKLLRVYGRKLIKNNENLAPAGEALAGRIPAVIRECVERAKLHAISERPEAEFFLTSTDIIRASEEMAPHLALLAGEKPAEETPAETMAKAMRQALGLTNGEDKSMAELVIKLNARLAHMQRALGINEE